MATQVEIQRKEWQDWVDRLVNNPDCVATQLEEAAKLLKENISLQNESKWGVEDGPQAFAKRYRFYLQQEVAALKSMAENARTFAGYVTQAIAMLDEKDQNAASWLNEQIKGVDAVYKNPSLFHRQPPPRPLPQVSYPATSSTSARAWTVPPTRPGMTRSSGSLTTTCVCGKGLTEPRSPATTASRSPTPSGRAAQTPTQQVQSTI